MPEVSTLDNNIATVRTKFKASSFKIQLFKTRINKLAYIENGLPEFYNNIDNTYLESKSILEELTQSIENNKIVDQDKYTIELNTVHDEMLSIQNDFYEKY
jgi:hypothetical protein